MEILYDICMFDYDDSVHLIMNTVHITSDNNRRNSWSRRQIDCIHFVFDKIEDCSQVHLNGVNFTGSSDFIEINMPLKDITQEAIVGKFLNPDLTLRGLAVLVLVIKDYQKFEHLLVSESFVELANRVNGAVVQILNLLAPVLGLPCIEKTTVVRRGPGS